jgi:hypothetical protein
MLRRIIVSLYYSVFLFHESTSRIKAKLEALLLRLTPIPASSRPVTESYIVSSVSSLEAMCVMFTTAFAGSTTTQTHLVPDYRYELPVLVVCLGRCHAFDRYGASPV